VLTITIDWLAVNFKEYTLAAETFFNSYARIGDTQDTDAHNGYTRATMDSNGTVVQWNPEYSSMGHHCIFSGSALRNIFTSTTTSANTLLKSCIDARGNISRLDMAKDLTEEPFDYEAVYQSLKQGNGGGNIRSFSKVESGENGYTIYMGSRQSERFARLYNKAAQSNLPDALWTRFEVETKGMVARAVAVSLIASRDWSGVFDSVVLGMVGNAKRVNLEQFFIPGNVPIGLPKIERQTDRESWIANQCIPAITRHYIDNPTSEAVTRLIAMLDLIDKQRKL
jgi:hypothetical protein